MSPARQAAPVDQPLAPFAEQQTTRPCHGLAPQRTYATEESFAAVALAHRFLELATARNFAATRPHRGPVNR